MMIGSQVGSDVEDNLEKQQQQQNCVVCQIKMNSSFRTVSSYGMDEPVKELQITNILKIDIILIILIHIYHLL